MRTIKNLIFPLIMVALGIATLARYSAIQNFRSRSTDHQIVVETGDIESVQRAIRDATFQPVESELISGDKYRIVVRCPPDKVGYVLGLMQRLGAKQTDE